MPVPLRVRSRAGLAAGTLLALLLLTPLLGSGYVLVRDMSFVPDPPLTGLLLGDQGVPRGVPSDLLVALASAVVPGWLVQDVVLVALVAGAAWGAARLVPAGTTAGSLTAATAYGWSVYLHERLLLGQWALLVGFAALPWGVRAALDWRQSRPGSGSRTTAALGVAALGGASAGLLAAVGVLPVLLGRSAVALRRTALALGAVVVLALPWLVPAVLAPLGAPPGDPDGVAAFASRSDAPGGLVVSVLTTGGVWAPAAVPDGRRAGVLLALAVVALALWGLPVLRARLGADALRGLLVGAGLALVLALAGRVPGLRDLLITVVTDVPGGGLLRDGHKWLAPYALLVAVGAGCGTDRLVERARFPVLVGALAAVLPVAALPGAAWGDGLSRSHYPDEWTQVGDVVAAQRTRGPVTVLPWTIYRAFAWTDDRTVLDPALRLLPQRALVNDDLPLSRGRVDGEDPVADVLDGAVAAGGPLLPALHAVGSPLVLVETGTRGFDPGVAAQQVAGLTRVWSEGELELWAVPGGGRAEERAPLLPLVLAQVAAGTLLVGAGARARRGPRTTGAGSSDESD